MYIICFLFKHRWEYTPVCSNAITLVGIYVYVFEKKKKKNISTSASIQMSAIKVSYISTSMVPYSDISMLSTRAFTPMDSPSMDSPPMNFSRKSNNKSFQRVHSDWSN